MWNNGTHDLCPYLFSKTLEHDRVTSPLCSHVDKIIAAIFPLRPRCSTLSNPVSNWRPAASWDGMLMQC